MTEKLLRDMAEAATYPNLSIRQFREGDGVCVIDSDKQGFSNYLVISGGDFSATTVKLESRFAIVWDGRYKHKLQIVDSEENVILTVPAGTLEALLNLLQQTHDRRFRDG